GGRADEDDPGLVAGARERRVLREEAVARVNRLGPGLPGRLDDLLDHQVALVGGARTDQVRLVGAARVGSVAVRLGVPGGGPGAELLERPEDANSYLAAVGDEHLGEHGRRNLVGC